jgi:DNA-binding response OmpR family regulator
MPLLDGISLVKCIREEESRSQRKSTKLVALTAMDYLAKNKNYLKEVGLDDYFLKPIRGSDLVEKINRLFAVKNAS